MKYRFWLYRRGRIYYVEDTLTRRQESLATTNRAEAEQLRSARESAVTQPHVNLAIGKAYLAAHDPVRSKRSNARILKHLQRARSCPHAGALVELTR